MENIENNNSLNPSDIACLIIKNLLLEHQIPYKFNVKYNDGFIEIEVYNVPAEKENFIFNVIYNLCQERLPDWNVLPLIYQNERMKTNVSTRIISL